MDQCDPRTSPIDPIRNSLGFVIGLLIMTGDYVLDFLRRRPRNDLGWQFLWTPQALVWIFLVSAQFAFWAHAIAPLWRRTRRLKRDFGFTFTPEMRVDCIITVVYFTLPIAFLTRILPDSHLKGHDLKILVINLLGLAAAMVAVVGLWYVREALQSLPPVDDPDGGPGPSGRQRLEQLIRLRRDLHRFLAFLGMMVTLATLSKGALRQAIVATGSPADIARFPTEYVLLQGAFFTGLLAMLYIPIHGRYVAAGDHLVDSIFPIDSSGLDLSDLGKWQANRRRLEELLLLHSKAVTDVRASVTILAPLATGVISAWLGTKA